MVRDALDWAWFPAVGLPGRQQRKDIVEPTLPIIGFDTPQSTAMDAIDKIQDTYSSSHHRKGNSLRNWSYGRNVEILLLRSHHRPVLVQMKSSWRRSADRRRSKQVAESIKEGYAKVVPTTSHSWLKAWCLQMNLQSVERSWQMKVTFAWLSLVAILSNVVVHLQRDQVLASRMGAHTRC